MTRKRASDKSAGEPRPPLTHGGAATNAKVEALIGALARQRHRNRAAKAERTPA